MYFARSFLGRTIYTRYIWYFPPNRDKHVMRKVLDLIAISWTDQYCHFQIPVMASTGLRMFFFDHLEMMTSLIYKLER